MRSALSPLRNLTAAVAATLALSATPLAASEDERIRILFLPPPMEGTLSLGIYDEEGQLVRTLHDEAEADEFHPAFNGLITHWDGNDDEGNRCAPGRYRARGYMVGDLKVAGIDFHGNGWYLDDDSPRLKRITRIAGLKEGRVLLEALQPGAESPALFIASPAPKGEEQSEVEEGEPEVWQAAPAPEGIAFPEAGLFDGPEAAKVESVKGVASPGPSTVSPDGKLWLIDGKTFGEYGVDGENLRTLHPLDGDLLPTRITATADYLFVLMESAAEQRLQGLPYETPDEARVDTAILFSDTLEQALPQLRFPDDSAFQPAEQLKLRLVSNPLLNDRRSDLSIRTEVTDEGTFLTTADGLPLRKISTTPHLLWAAIGQKKGKNITLFESDGAVVAEYRISKPERMMAFDAGTYRLRAPKAQPTPTPTPTPTESVPEATESAPAENAQEGEDGSADSNEEPKGKAEPQEPEAAPEPSEATDTEG